MEIEIGQITCVRESVYSHALTRGRAYEAVQIDREKRQVRVRTNEGKLRWFPIYCVDVSGENPPAELNRVDVEDSIRDPDADWIEVRVHLSDGSRRWCAVTTPRHIASTGDPVESEDGSFRLHFGLRHVLIVNELSDTVIRVAVDHVHRQGELVECTLPLME